MLLVQCVLHLYQYMSSLDSIINSLGHQISTRKFPLVLFCAITSFLGLSLRFIALVFYDVIV